MTDYQSFDLSNPDIGMMAVSIGGGQTVKLDVFEINNRIAELSREFEDRPVREFHNAIADLMVEKGLPPASHFMASRFAEHVGKLAGDLEGKAESATGSPAESRDSTASTASGGPTLPPAGSSSPDTPPT